MFRAPFSDEGPTVLRAQFSDEGPTVFRAQFSDEGPTVFGAHLRMKHFKYHCYYFNTSPDLRGTARFREDG